MGNEEMDSNSIVSDASPQRMRRRRRDDAGVRDSRKRDNTSQDNAGGNAVPDALCFGKIDGANAASN